MNYPTSWNLSRYFYSWLDDARLQSDIEKILPATYAFRDIYKNTLENFQKPEEILQFYKDYETLQYTIGTSGYYLFYLSSLDTQNTEVLKKMGELQFLHTEASNELLFVSQAWKTIGYEKIMEWSNSPLLAWYRNDLISTAENLKYILSEKEEKTLNIKSRPLSLANDLHDELTGSFEFSMNIHGEEKKLTEEEVRSYRQHTERAIREEAYKSLRRVYNTKQNQITLGNIYTSIVKDWSTDIQLRGYTTVMEPRNLSEEMDNATIDTLIAEVTNAYPIYNRFLKAKARILWIDNFAVWDTGAPIGSTDKDYSFDEAFDLHLSVMKDFDEEFYEYSKKMIEEERIDVFPKSGKRGGAYASYRKWDESFVLLNFTGKLRDVATISHELWHAIHGHLSQAQEWAVYDSPLSLAETASIFSEMLLWEKIKTLISKEEYLDYLNERLWDIFATIFRQIQYIVFEKQVHESIHAGKELTFKELNILWRNEQEKLFWDSVRFDVDKDNESGWSMIPHIFHTPFYCYAYAFWNILTFSLYNLVQWGQLSVEDYKNILRAGWSEKPKDLLAKYWIDITHPEFYKAGIKEIETLVSEFESLIS